MLFSFGKLKPGKQGGTQHSRVTFCQNGLEDVECRAYGSIHAWGEARAEHRPTDGHEAVSMFSRPIVLLRPYAVE